MICFGYTKLGYFKTKTDIFFLLASIYPKKLKVGCPPHSILLRVFKKKAEDGLPRILLLPLGVLLLTQFS
jgi:hypothetical protein